MFDDRVTTKDFFARKFWAVPVLGIVVAAGVGLVMRGRVTWDDVVSWLILGGLLTLANLFLKRAVQGVHSADSVRGLKEGTRGLTSPSGPDRERRRDRRPSRSPGGGRPPCGDNAVLSVFLSVTPATPRCRRPRTAPSARMLTAVTPGRPGRGHDGGGEGDARTATRPAAWRRRPCVDRDHGGPGVDGLVSRRPAGTLGVRASPTASASRSAGLPRPADL